MADEQATTSPRACANGGLPLVQPNHWRKAIFRTEIKRFRHAALNPEMTTVLLVAPTGVAAVNINGTTINSALAIP